MNTPDESRTPGERAKPAPSPSPGSRAAPGQPAGATPAARRTSPPVAIAEEALQRADRAFEGIARSVGTKRDGASGGVAENGAGADVDPALPATTNGGEVNGAASGTPGGSAASDRTGLRLLDDVDLDVRIELGRTRMIVEDVLRLGTDSVVELDKAAGDPVDIYVNGRHIARGEVLVVNENFCVRVSEILEPLDRSGGAVAAH